jgi:hydroxyacylglutathione hydrolase
MVSDIIIPEHEMEEGEGFRLTGLEVGVMENNCYLLQCLETGEGIVVDPADEPERILKALNGMRVKYILLTHSHWDHIGALGQIKEATGARVGVQRLDAERVKRWVDFYLEDGQEIRFGSNRVRVIHTPGHSPGGVCLLLGKSLLSGDTIFPGGPGNTSIPGADHSQILRSIEEKIFVLPAETVILPGHGRTTTVGAEIGTAPYRGA